MKDILTIKNTKNNYREVHVSSIVMEVKRQVIFLFNLKRTKQQHLTNN